MGNSTGIKRTGKSIHLYFSEAIPEDSPIAMANISSGKMTIVTNDPSQRYYYLMVFNNKYRVKVLPATLTSPAYRISAI